MATKSVRAVVILGAMSLLEFLGGCNQNNATHKAQQKSVQTTQQKPVQKIKTSTCENLPTLKPSSLMDSQTMEAVAPEGQFISLITIPTLHGNPGPPLSCGIHVKKIKFGSAIEGSSAADANVFTAVAELEMVNNKLECAYSSKPNGEEADKTAQTTFSDVDYRSGHILMTVANLPFSEPNKKYKLTLTGPTQGTMVSCD